jgi:hypothetical protein
MQLSVQLLYEYKQCMKMHNYKFHAQHAFLFSVHSPGVDLLKVVSEKS